MNEHGHAVGVEEVGHPTSAANEHSRGGVGCNEDENTFFVLVCRCFGSAYLSNSGDLKPARLIVSGLSEIDFVRSLTERQLPQRTQIGASKKSFQCSLHHFWLIDRTAL